MDKKHVIKTIYYYNNNYREREFMFGRMGENMMGNGLMVNSMVMVSM